MKFPIQPHWRQTTYVYIHHTQLSLQKVLTTAIRGRWSVPGTLCHGCFSVFGAWLLSAFPLWAKTAGLLPSSYLEHWKRFTSSSSSSSSLLWMWVSRRAWHKPLGFRFFVMVVSHVHFPQSRNCSQKLNHTGFLWLGLIWFSVLLQVSKDADMGFHSHADMGFHSQRHFTLRQWQPPSRWYQSATLLAINTDQYLTAHSSPRGA